MATNAARPPYVSRFTLTELAIVVAIVALLVGGTVLTISAQNSAREINDTRRTLEMARDVSVMMARLPTG